MFFCLEKIGEMANIVKYNAFIDKRSLIMKEKVFNVSGMSCNHCVMAVKEAAEGIDGVAAAEVDLEQGTAKVTFSDEVAESDIVEAIEEEGFKIS